MVMHMHYYYANAGLGNEKLKEFWDWLESMIRTYQVKVVMGDFNMCLFRVIPEFRSRGVTVDLAAWFPWKTKSGELMADSCGIFFIDEPGEHRLHKGLKDLHAENETGILHPAKEG